jgi:hypothetical protein
MPPLRRTIGSPRLPQLRLRRRTIGSRLRAKQEAEPNPAFSQETLPKPAAPDDGALQRIAGEGVKGAVEGFGSEPLGLSEQSQDGLVKAGIYNDKDEYNPLKGLNKAVIGGAAAVGDLALRTGGAMLRGAQGVVAQTGAELGAPQLGREIAAIPEAFMGSPEMLQRTPSPRTTAREVQARDNVGIMEAWNRARIENTAALADIGKATDIDGAIAAAGKAVEAPEPAVWSVDDRFGPTAAPTPAARITASQVQRRDGVGAIEAGRRAAAENAAAADTAIPQEVSNVPSGWSVDDRLGVGQTVDTTPPVAPEPAPIRTPETQASFYAPEARGQTEPLPATIEAPSNIPQTAAEAKAVASAYYQKADEVGGTLLPDFTNRFIDKAESIAPQTEEGRAVAGDTAITGLVDRIQALRDKPISLKGAQEIDERLGDLIDGEFGMRGLSKEGHNLLDLQSTFRDMILDAGPADTTNGTAGFEALKQGRAAWSQAMKMADFERILNRAAQTDNPVTSIRTGIRTLLSNPTRARGYSAAEKSALQDAANRGALGSVLHVFGSRLAPLAVGAAGMAGGVIPGLIGAGLTHGATSMMRSAATNLQMRRTGNAMSVLGSSVPKPPQ